MCSWAIYRYFQLNDPSLSLAFTWKPHTPRFPPERMDHSFRFWGVCPGHCTYVSVYCHRRSLRPHAHEGHAVQFSGSRWLSMVHVQLRVSIVAVVQRAAKVGGPSPPHLHTPPFARRSRAAPTGHCRQAGFQYNDIDDCLTAYRIGRGLVHLKVTPEPLNGRICRRRHHKPPQPLTHSPSRTLTQIAVLGDAILRTLRQVEPASDIRHGRA